ncbi:hypothetical protein HXX76_008274 [Chlamydomonas incerta]|uniref:Sfi1 spindle body domain-containing protein n=1 Tax=Chlamydomonas incerta TaxID=51695 RepID=A0A835SYR0_CHLIN|nr:hypothetical protein HXX76_008274 [Chlamydomonas incerta]|eukprot:KAG2433922.1 hypothetical protein HXX76_008274 [Chlamydomonas incerta]
MPKGRPEDVFREAKKLVEDVRLSRQRSPPRLAAPASLELGLQGSGLGHAGAYSPAAPGLGSSMHLKDSRFASAKDGLGAAASSLADSWLAYDGFHGGTGAGDAAPSRGGEDDLGRAWSFQAATGAGRSPGPMSPTGKSAAFAAGGAAAAVAHASDAAATAADGGDTTPSRWQKLTQRVNAAAATGGAGLSPQRASQLLQPSSPASGTVATGKLGGTLLSGAASPGTGAAGAGASQFLFPDQPSKAARLSSPSSSALPFPGSAGDDAISGRGSTAFRFGLGLEARPGQAAGDAQAAGSSSLLHSALGAGVSSDFGFGSGHGIGYGSGYGSGASLLAGGDGGGGGLGIGYSAAARAGVTAGFGVGGAAYGGSGGGGGGGAGHGGKALSPFERAVAALQQAEQQLRDHQGKGPGVSADGASGAAAAVEEPANAALLAAERFLRSGPGKAAPARASAGAGAGAIGMAGGARGAVPVQRNAGGGTRATGSTAAGAGEGSFEDVAMGMLRRLTAAAPLGGPPAAAAPMLRTYAALEPPPAQHVVAAAALAAARAVATTRGGEGAGEGSGDGGGGLRSGVPGGVAAAVSRAAAPPAAPELEFQITMQGLMAAAHQAASEEALQAERERRRREAAAAAEAEIAAGEARTVALLRRALYLHLWRLAAAWGRREAQELRRQLATGRLRRCLAAWHQATRTLRLERLAEEALEVAAEARRLQVADQFRRLALLHRSLLAWQAAAAECAQERLAGQEAAARQLQEQHADAVREAAADRFRCLWLLHSCLRTWRTTARARAAARATLGAALPRPAPPHVPVPAGAAGQARGGAAGSAEAGVATAAEPRAVLSGRERDQHRRAAVESLLSRLKTQRDAFMQDGTGTTDGGSSSAAEPRPATAAPLHPSSSRPHGAPARPATAAPAPGPASPPPPHAAFPGLNKFVRPAVMRDGVAPPGHGRGSSGGGAGGAAATRATRPQPFKLSTDRRAAHRRHQVLSACEATRQLVAPSGGPVHDTQMGAERVDAAARSQGRCDAHGQWQPAGYAAGQASGDAYGAGVGGTAGAWCAEPRHAAERNQVWAPMEEADDDAGSAWSESEQHPQPQLQPEEAEEHEDEGNAERWGACSVSSSLQQGSGRWGGEPGEDEEEAQDTAQAADSRGVGEGEAASGRPEAGCQGTVAAASDHGRHARHSQRASHGEQLGFEAHGDVGAGGEAAAWPDPPQEGRYHSVPGGDLDASGQSVRLAGGPEFTADEGALVDDDGDGRGCHGQPFAHQQRAWLPAEQQHQRASAVGAQASRDSLHSSCSASRAEQQHQQQPPVVGSHSRPAAPAGRAAGAAGNSPPAAAARPRSAHHSGASGLTHGRPASTRLPPGTWRPPSPPKDNTSRPTTAGSARPASASRDHRRNSPGGVGGVTTSRRGTTAMAVATSLLQQVGTAAGAAAGLGPALTAADVERLRAAEVRRRRQADEKARALAAELTAHMTALAEAHHRRSLLLWFGMGPWIQLLLLARQQQQLAAAHRDLVLLRAALLGFARAVVRARMRRAAEQAAAVSRGRFRRRSRLALAVLDRLSAAAAAAGLYRRHLSHRVLLAFMRNASDAWTARAGAEDFASRRRLWTCFAGWRKAAEDQASSRLLRELQAQHSAEQVLGRHRAARVLAAWRRLTEEGAAQRAELQVRSQKWAKVQGWLREVHESRASGAAATAPSRASAGSVHSSAVADSGAGFDRGELLLPSALMRLELRGEYDLPSSLGVEWDREPGGGAGGTGRADGWGQSGGGHADDPLGLGPIEDQLQQFSLGPSGIARQQHQAGSSARAPLPGSAAAGTAAALRGPPGGGCRPASNNADCCRVIMVVAAGSAPTAADAQALEACMAAETKTATSLIALHEVDIEMAEEALDMPIASNGYDLINEQPLGPMDTAAEAERADHAPRQGGGCAMCPTTLALYGGLCRRCDMREYRKT